MHIINVFFIILFAVAPFIAQASDVKSVSASDNGNAIGVVCKNADGSLKSVELLDLYEARTVHNMPVSVQGSLDEVLTVMRTKLNTLFQDVKSLTTPVQYIDDSETGMKIAHEDILWAPVTDMPAIVLPQGCHLERIADASGEALFQVQGVLWAEMEDVQRAAVIVHQAIRSHLKSMNSNEFQFIRKQVAYLFSSQPVESLLAGVPEDANECTAFNVLDPANVAFHFYKFQNPQNDIEEVLQFSKFRNQYPYGITTVITPKWSWAKEDGDLFKEVQSTVESYEPLYIRRDFSAGDDERFYFSELSGDYEVSCAQSPKSKLSLLKITSIGAFESVAVGGRRTLLFEVSNLGEGKALSLSVAGLAAPFAFAGGSYPGTGGTCGKNLAPKSKCLVAIDFAPQSTGKFASTLTVKYNNGTSPDSASIDINGAGMGPSNLTLSDVPSYVFTSITVGASRDHTVRVTNLGGLRATNIRDQGLKAPFMFKGGKFPGEGGTCADYLDTNSSCNLVITFAPTAKGTFKGTIELFYFNGAHETMTAKEATGSSILPGRLQVTGVDPMDMGVVAIGGFSEVTIGFKNVGESAISSMSGTGLASPFSFANGYYPGKGGNCSSTLSIGGSCTMVVRFIPMITTSSAESLEVFYFDGAVRQMVSRDLVGAGASPAVLTISDAPKYNFGFVSPGATVERSFTVANVGAVAATSMVIKNLDAPFSYSIKGATCGATLAAGATCTVRVAFTPHNEGEFSTALHISYSNGTTASTVERELLGRAGEPAQLIMATGTLYSYGSVAVGSSATMTFTVFNTGKTAATELKMASAMGGAFVFEGGAYPGLGGTCGDTLEVYAACTLTVAFTPSLPGPYAKTLALSYFNGVTQQIAVQYLEGTGISTRGHEPWNLLFTGL